MNKISASLTPARSRTCAQFGEIRNPAECRGFVWYGWYLSLGLFSLLENRRLRTFGDQELDKRLHFV